MNDVVSNADLDGAIHTVDRLIDALRQLQAHGIAPSVEEMALASLHDGDGDPLRTVARLSLLLAVTLQRLAAQ
ncbi:hypothetical protein [Mycobacterium sp. URHB0021]